MLDAYTLLPPSNASSIVSVFLHFCSERNLWQWCPLTFLFLSWPFFSCLFFLYLCISCGLFSRTPRDVCFVIFVPVTRSSLVLSESFSFYVPPVKFHQSLLFLAKSFAVHFSLRIPSSAFSHYVPSIVVQVFGSTWRRSISKSFSFFFNPHLDEVCFPFRLTVYFRLAYI